MKREELRRASGWGRRAAVYELANIVSSDCLNTGIKDRFGSAAKSLPFLPMVRRRTSGVAAPAAADTTMGSEMEVIEVSAEKERGGLQLLCQSIDS